MNPVRASLRYPQVTIALTIMLVAGGAYALMRMPRREDPKIHVREGIVAAMYPGASAAEVENQVTQKVEQRLFKLEGVRREKTYSTSMNGAMFINLNLEDNLQDTEKFWSKLRLDMAELKQTDLPDGVLGPVVDYDFGDTVAVLLAIHSDHYGYRELKDYAERIESVIRRIRAVSKVKRIGEQKEEIDVSSTLSRLSQYSVSAEQVMKALEGRNMVHYAGAVPTQRGKPPIQATGAFETEDQIRHVMIDVSRTGQPVYIGDLANVDRVYKDPTQYARSRGERAIMLSVEMQEGNNIVDFGKEVHASLDSLRPLLPPDLKIEFVADQPTVVADRVKHFIREFGIAIASVILVTMLLLPFRVALVSAVAIPVTISATFGLLNAFGIELHQVSLAALIVVLGMVVDDAIVIADNYIELLDHGLPRSEAAWRSASELAVPVLTATLTIICSFLPFLILSGATGEFIRALPLTVAIALSTSFLVGMLLTPLLSQFFIKKGLHSPDAAAGKKRRSPLDIMQAVYNRVIAMAMNWKPAAVVLGVFAVAAGVFVLHRLPERFFPFAERDQFVADIWLPEGWKVEATEAAVKRIEDVLREEREVVNYTSFIGSSFPRFYYNVNPQLPDKNYAQLLVSTTSAEVTPGLIRALRPRLAQAAPEARVFLSELQQGPVQLAAIEVRLTGDDERVLRHFGDQVMQRLQSTPGSLDVHSDWREDAYRMKVNLREEVANRLGFTNATIGQELAGGFEGGPVTTYWEGERDIAVALRLEPARRQTFNDVANTYVISPVTGARVPLDSIAAVSPVWDPGRIVRRNGVRTLTIRSWSQGGVLPSQVLERVRPVIDKLPLPAGYRVWYGGEYENQNDTFPEMVKALLISVVAIYLILMFQFRSVIDPFVVMSAIPLGLLGASLGLMVTHNPFGFTGFLGIVSLGGVAVRNSIILVDYTRERMKEGVPIEDAAIEAGERRLRPIFLTTMAAAVGVTPMILSGSSMWSPLGSAIAFGLVGSMFFTLVVIPVLYVLIHKRDSGPSPVGPIAAAALMLVACGAAAHAQPRKLTLDEAVSLAAQHNSMVKIAGDKVKAMDARVKESRAGFFPALTNDSTSVHIADQQHIDIPQGALGVYPGVGPIPGAGVSLAQGKPNFLLSTTTLSQPITQYFKTRAGVDVSRADAAGARADMRRTENEIAYKVKEIYYAILATERRRNAVDAQIRAAELRNSETRNAVVTGVLLEVNAAEVKAQIAQATHASGQLQDAVMNMREELADLCGLSVDADLELVRPDGGVTAVSLDAEASVNAAYAHNPEIETAAHQVEKARAALRAARAEYIPEVGAFAQHIYQDGAPFLSRNNGAFGVHMTWTMFEFGKRRGQVSERGAEIAQAEENLARLKNRVRIDVEKAVRKLNRAETGVNSARELVAATTEARRVSSDQAEIGTANRSVFLESEASMLSAQADLLRAEYDRSVAAAELTRLTGNQ
ncbi:Acriflavin resistance protein [Candidatus Sulfopaludibacter sp. SbA4]|nr:Acriflavin resistance protein [Candidatus Sulfopaludibacter sp. SbA4]